MRYALLSALVFVGCKDLAVFRAASENATKPADASTIDVPPPPCGDGSALPEGVTVDETSLVASCDGEAKVLAVTPLAEGIFRLRYGEDARGSLVPVARVAETLVTGRRGAAALVCGSGGEIAIVPHSCAIVAKDASGAVVLDDPASGFFVGRERPRGASVDGDVVGITRSLAGDHVFGLGLHAPVPRGLDLRGASIELYNTDAYDSTAGGFPNDAPHLYEAIPFYLGVRGTSAYGIFTDNTHRLRFDVSDASVRITAWDGAIDQYLVTGPRMPDVVRRYTALTGRMPLPPPWSLGFHQSRWEADCDGAPAEKPFCSASQIAALAQRFRDEKIPADGLFLDIQHMDGFRSFTFDGARFGDPEALTAKLAALGFATHAIVDPGIKIDPAWSTYTDGLAAGHFLADPAGVVYEGTAWPGPTVFPDFSAPKTRAWWSDLVVKEVARGIRGLWIDLNEPSSFRDGTAPDALVAAGDGRATTMAEAHNLYGYYEAKATYEGMRTARPSERPFVLSRSAFAGQAKYSAVWTGDAPSAWSTLAGTLPQILALGLSGMPFAGSDVGGYSGRADASPDLFARWMALGAVSPFFRAHAANDARRQEPWSFGPEVLDATRTLVRLRYALMPYLYDAFERASRTGAPVLRPLFFDFADDARALDVADEAMFGDALLVAPLLDGGRTVYFPGGRDVAWYEWHSGLRFAGGTVAPLPAGLPKDALPLFVRAGAIVATTDPSAYVGETVSPRLVFEVFPGPETTSALYEDDGVFVPNVRRTTITYAPSASGARVTFAHTGDFAPAHAVRLLRLRRVDRMPTRVTIDGAVIAARADLTEGFAWDENDRTLTIVLPVDAKTVDVTYDPTLDAEGDVDVPITVVLPASTPAGPISIASSPAWSFTPLTRSGTSATGTFRAPRGSYVLFKVTRGGWASVEKDASCNELANRDVVAAGVPITATVARWADGCP